MKTKGLDVQGNKNIINAYSLSNQSVPAAKNPSMEKKSANEYSLLEIAKKIVK